MKFGKCCKRTRQECNQCGPAEQRNFVGALDTHHPDHTGGPGKDSHGTLVPKSGKAMGGPIMRSAKQQLMAHEMQKLFNIIKK